MTTLTKEDNCKDVKVYTYSEAIALAGNGWYSVSLLVTLSLSLLSMIIDLFSFSTLVTFCSCDFQLTLTQKSILISIPFIGPVVMAYAWGYICDTRGRQKSLLITMTISFVMAVLCAFSPNWILLAIFKLIGTCCCSCSHSASGTLLGESCSDRIKGTYLVIMSSTMHMAPAVYLSLGYFISHLDFIYDLGFITFVPWRLFALLLALPLGLSSLGLIFLHESPKFLLNADREHDALDVLRSICRRNGGDVNNYPVKKVVLNEVGNISRKNIPLLQSMKEQTIPLFTPPLLFHTLVLYFIVFVIFFSNSAVYAWLPFIAKAITASSSEDSQGFCNMIAQSSLGSNTTNTEICSATIDLPIVIAAIVFGVTICSLNVLISRFASRKKLLKTTIISTSAASCLLTVAIPSNASNYLYFGVLTSSMCWGLISGYFVDLYPTSFRAMVACLCVMLARLSGILGINVVGYFLTSHCTATFYSLSVFIFTGVVACFFLPPDRPKTLPKTVSDTR